MNTQEKELETFGPVISSYTQAQAVDDGCLVEIAKLPSGKKIVFSRALFCDLGGEDENPELGQTAIRHMIKKGVELLKIADPEDSPNYRLRVIKPGEAWVIMDLNGLTFLRPDDY
jgi:hypothetical protein